MRVPADRPRARVFSRDSRRRRCVEWARKAAVHCERLRDGRWQLRKRHSRPNRLHFPRRSSDLGARDQSALGVDRNRADRVPVALTRRDEVERLAGHRSSNRHDTIRRRSRERESDHRARLGARGSNGETRGLRGEPPARDARKYEYSRCLKFHELSKYRECPAKANVCLPCIGLLDSRAPSERLYNIDCLTLQCTSEKP